MRTPCYRRAHVGRVSAGTVPRVGRLGTVVAFLLHFFLLIADRGQVCAASLGYLLTDDGRLQVIDTTDGNVRKVLRLGQLQLPVLAPDLFDRGGRPLAISADGRRLFALSGSLAARGSLVLCPVVSAIDTVTHAVITRIPIGLSGVNGVTATPDGTQIFVAGYRLARLDDNGDECPSPPGAEELPVERDIVLTIDVDSGRVLERTLGCATPPVSIDGEHLYCLGGRVDPIFDTATEVLRLDRTVGAATAVSLLGDLSPLEVTDGSLSITGLSPDAARLFVVSGSRVLIIDTTSGAAIGDIMGGGLDRFLPSGAHLSAVSPDGSRVFQSWTSARSLEEFLSAVNGTTPGLLAIDVIDPATQQQLARIPTAGAPLVLTTTADGIRLLVLTLTGLDLGSTGGASEGFTATFGVQIIDTTSNTTIARIEDTGLIFGFAGGTGCTDPSRCFCSVSADCNDRDACTIDSCLGPSGCAYDRAACFEGLACLFEREMIPERVEVEDLCPNRRIRRRVDRAQRHVLEAQTRSEEASRARASLRRARGQLLKAMARLLRGMARPPSDDAFGFIPDARQSCRVLLFGEQLERLRAIRGLQRDLRQCIRTP